VVAGAIGNALEFYDFAVFAYLVPILGTLFFPQGNRRIVFVHATGRLSI
jgi:hypothetical protein